MEFAGNDAKFLKTWCRQRELNSRPHHYQWCALPLSYGGSGVDMAQWEARIKNGVMMDENKFEKMRHGTNLPEQDLHNEKDRLDKVSGREARLAEKMRENLRRRKAKLRSLKK